MNYYVQRIDSNGNMSLFMLSSYDEALKLKGDFIDEEMYNRLKEENFPKIEEESFIPEMPSEGTEE